MASHIRTMYWEEPKFPAKDQHPDAVRYILDHSTRGRIWVDAVGGAPTMVQVDEVIEGTHG